MRIIRIILSIILIMGGIGGIKSGEIMSSIFCILCGISMIPTIYEKMKL